MRSQPSREDVSFTIQVSSLTLLVVKAAQVLDFKVS